MNAMPLEKAYSFWCILTYGSKACIPPIAMFNDEFELGLFKETSDGYWYVDETHTEYSYYWREAFGASAAMLYARSACTQTYYIGHSHCFKEWTSPIINVLAVIEDDNFDVVTTLCTITDSLNAFLHKTPRAWTPKSPRIHLSVQNASKAFEGDTLHPDRMIVLYGTNTWFNHRNTITGLLLEPRLSRCYNVPWTPCAVDILLNGSAEHQLELRILWTQGRVSESMFNQVSNGLSSYLSIAESLCLSDSVWLEHLNLYLAATTLVTINLPPLEDSPQW